MPLVPGTPLVTFRCTLVANDAGNRMLESKLYCFALPVGHRLQKDTLKAAEWPAWVIHSIECPASIVIHLLIYLCVLYLQPLSCVAAGFLPLEHNTNNPGVVSMIGVTCEPGGTLLGYAGKQSSTSTSQCPFICTDTFSLPQEGKLR